VDQRREKRMSLCDHEEREREEGRRRRTGKEGSPNLAHLHPLHQPLRNDERIESPTLLLLSLENSFRVCIESKASVSATRPDSRRAMKRKRSIAVELTEGVLNLIGTVDLPPSIDERFVT